MGAITRAGHVEQIADLGPATYSCNYIGLLGGETRCVDRMRGSRCELVAVRGWNVEPREVRIRGAR